ncbi:MAG: hypothetical protein AAFV98_03795 [Chloroflexota bacterium]
MRNWVDYALAVSVSIIPFVILIILLALYYNATIFDYHMGFTGTEATLPSDFSDEVFYYAQAKAFSAVGIDSGYFTRNELTAQADYAHYYAWGLFPPMLYGFLGQLFGMHIYSIVLFNMGLLTCAILFAIIVVQPNRTGMMCFGALIASYPTIIIFAPTSFLQILNLAFAIVLGVLVYHFLRDDRKPPSFINLILVSVIVILFSLIRVSWLFTLFPLFAYWGWQRKRIFGAILLLAGASVLFIIVYLFVGQTSSPYPTFLADMLRHYPNFYRITVVGLRNVWANILAIHSLPLIHVVARYQAFVIFGGCVYLMWRMWRNPNKPVISAPQQLPIHTFTLGTILVLLISILTFEGLSFYRALSPQILFSLVLLWGFGMYRIVGTFVICHLIIFIPTLTQFQVIAEPHFVEQTEDIRAYMQAYEQMGVTYLADANSERMV